MGTINDSSEVKSVFAKKGFSLHSEGTASSCPYLEYRLSLGVNGKTCLYFIFGESWTRGIMLMGRCLDIKKANKVLKAFSRKNRGWDYQITPGGHLILRYDMLRRKYQPREGAEKLLSEFGKNGFRESMGALFRCIDPSDAASFYEESEALFNNGFNDEPINEATRSGGKGGKTATRLPPWDIVYMVFGLAFLIAGIVFFSILGGKSVEEVVVYRALGFSFIMYFLSIAPFLATDKAINIGFGWRFLMFVGYILLAGLGLYLYISTHPALPADTEITVTLCYALSMTTPITFLFMYLIRIEKPWSRKSYCLLMPFVMILWPLLYIIWCIFLAVLIFGGFALHAESLPDQVDLTIGDDGQLRDSNGVLYDRNSDGTVKKRE